MTEQKLIRGLAQRDDRGAGPPGDRGRHSRSRRRARPGGRARAGAGDGRGDPQRGEGIGAPPPDIRKIIAASAIALAKVSTLAVAEPYRGSGIGAALLSRVKKIYFANGYFYVYGQIRPDKPGLATLYRRQGFEVREPDEGLDLRVVFGIPRGIRPDQGERFFVRGRPRDN
uniref:GNAT family N-acetyltransferase n=1 Tax=Amycolatopsis sp. CA-096443 TaxID=3239919 RepID=UPI003F498372